MSKNNLLEQYLIEVLIQDYYQSKGILLENQLDEGKLKDFIKSVKDNFKSSLRPKFNNLLKGLELTGKPASSISFLSTLKNLGIDLTDKKEVAAAVAYISNKKTIKEAEGDVVEKDGKKFIETTDPFSGKKLLIPEKDYERVGDKLEKGGSNIIGKLNNFFTNKRLGKVLKGVLIAAPLFAGLADEIGDAAEQAGDAAGLGDLDITGNDAPSAETIRGLMNAGFSSSEIGDYLDSQFAVDTGGQEGGIVDDVESAIDGDVDDTDLATDDPEVSDAKSQGLDIEVSGDETVNFTNFDLGSSQLDQGDKDKISTENSNIIKFLQNGQDYGETILGVASNTGPNSNVDDQGGDLNTNRLNNTADFILNDLESQLKEQGIEYTRSGNTIELEDGASYTLERAGGNNPNNLNKIDRTDDTATQSAIRIGTEGNPPEPTRLFGFDPVRPEKTPDADPNPSKPDEPKPDKPSKDDKEEIVPLPSKVEVIYPGNRLHQYGMISQLMNGINFFKSIGATQDPSGRPLTDSIINGDNTGITKYRSSYNSKPDSVMTKKIYNNTLKNLIKNGWSEDDAKNLLARVATTPEGKEITDIASWIIMSRKGPDKIINYLNEKFPGLDIGERDQAFFTINEINKTYLKFQLKQKILKEALIDKTSQLPSLSNSLVKNNLAQIVGLVTSMYFDAKGGNPLSYNNVYLEKNAPDYNKMKKFVRIVSDTYGVIGLNGYNASGLTQGKILAGQPQALSGPGQTMDKKPDGVEKDAEKVTKALDQNTNAKTKLNLINTKEELQLLILNVLKLTNQNFAKQDSNIKSYMMAISNQVKALKEDKANIDVDKVTQVLTTSLIRNKILTINTKDELKDLIVNVILPNINDSLKKNLGALRGALIGAGNAYKYDSSEVNENDNIRIFIREIINNTLVK